MPSTHQSDSLRLPRITPSELSPGDTIGLLSPSSPEAARFPRRFARAVHALEALGYSVKLSNNVRCDGLYTAGTPQMRLDDLHELFSDHRVKAIITSIGGSNTNQLLDQLDYRLIASNPKLVIGYSDATALLLAIWQKTGLGVAMGPQLMPQFGEYGGCLDYTVCSLLHLLGPAHGTGVIEPSKTWTDEYLSWDRDDTRPRIQKPNSGPYIIKPGHTTGWLIGANLPTLLRLAGTEFWPDLCGAILLLETTGSADISEFDAQLTQLRHLGVLSEITGLGFGRFSSESVLDRSPLLAHLVNEVFSTLEGPVVAGLDIGHTDPMLTVPYGIRATLHAVEDFYLIYDEESVGS